MKNKVNRAFMAKKKNLIYILAALVLIGCGGKDTSATQEEERVEQVRTTVLQPPPKLESFLIIVPYKHAYPAVFHSYFLRRNTGYMIIITKSHSKQLYTLCLIYTIQAICIKSRFFNKKCQTKAVRHWIIVFILKTV